MRSNTLALSMPLAVLMLAGSPAALGQVLYPEGEAVTRMATPTERLWMLANPAPALPKNVTNGAPAGTVVGSGEYDPAEAIIMAWEGGTTLNNIQRVMIRNITTLGDADVYLVFDTAAERDSVMPTFSTNTLSTGTVVSRVKPVIATTDTIWLRDYGPRYVYEDGVRVISDHTYNVTSRTNDNALPVPFGAFRKHAVYTLPLRHGGGNYHLNSLGQGYATALITNENTTLTQAAIDTLWINHWGTDTNFTGALATSVDGTQHIDMWMQIVADNKVMISDFVAQSGTAQDNLVDNQAALMASQGWEVFRLPARNTGGAGNVHYTYTNVVMCNNIVLVPQYSNALISPLNAQAIATWQAALPGKTIVPVDCEGIVTLSGVMHCIVMHMPKSKGQVINGGIAPMARLRQPRGGQTLQAGSTYQIRWITDDDVAVTSADIELSTDGGATYPVAIQTAGPDSWNFNWTVPTIATNSARIRITARDADGRAVSVASPSNFSIIVPCLADISGPGQSTLPDGQLTADDVIVFLGRYFSSTPSADIAGPNQVPGADGLFSADDIIVYLGRFFAGC